MGLNSILFLTYWYPNKTNKSLGIFVKRHAHAVKLNNNLVILSLNITKGTSFYTNNVSVFYDEMSIETHQINLSSKFNKLLYILLPLHYFLLSRYINNTLNRKYHFNILHSNILFPCAIVGYWLSKKFNYTHVITEHWSKIDKFFSISLFRTFGRTALNKAAAITCVSNQLATTLKKHTTNSNLHIIPNVIDGKDFYYDSSILKNETFTFIAVAHWVQPKNPFYFLNALLEIVQENRITGFKMVIVGTGEQISKIKQSNYNFEIEYKNMLNSEEVCQQLNKSNIFLHGSDFETFSVTIAEAIMCGLPSVVSPVGIAPEVINSSNGFVTNNTLLDWKEKIMLCYKTTYNNQQIANQLKNKFDLTLIGELFDKVYAEALGKY